MLRNSIEKQEGISGPSKSMFLEVVDTEGQGVITVRVLSGLFVFVFLQCRDSWSAWTKCNGVVWSGWIRELSWGAPGGRLTCTTGFAVGSHSADRNSGSSQSIKVWDPGVLGTE